MARLNVYVPDDLAADVKKSDVNVSKVTQAALRKELARRQTAIWLDRVRVLPRSGVSHDAVMDALDAAREEFGDKRG